MEGEIPRDLAPGGARSREAKSLGHRFPLRRIRSRDQAIDDLSGMCSSKSKLKANAHPVLEVKSS